MAGQGFPPWLQGGHLGQSSDTCSHVFGSGEKPLHWFLVSIYPSCHNRRKEEARSWNYLTVVRGEIERVGKWEKQCSNGGLTDRSDHRAGRPLPTWLHYSGNEKKADENGGWEDRRVNTVSLELFHYQDGVVRLISIYGSPHAQAHGYHRKMSIKGWNEEQAVNLQRTIRWTFPWYFLKLWFEHCQNHASVSVSWGYQYQWPDINLITQI